ncbi:hypothetical protein MRX96_029282 [Rhipicephalus microplus]
MTVERSDPRVNNTDKRGKFIRLLGFFVTTSSTTPTSVYQFRLVVYISDRKWFSVALRCPCFCISVTRPKSTAQESGRRAGGVRIRVLAARAVRKGRQPETAMRDTPPPPDRLAAGLTHAPLTDFLWKVSAHCWTHSPTARTHRGGNGAQADLDERSLFLSTTVSPSSLR